MLQPSLAFAQEHYYDLRNKPFYPGLTRYFSSGPIVAMVWEGKNVIKVNFECKRRLAMATLF